MNRVAIAFSTCDRVELSRQSIEPLLQPDKFDLHWVDGSKTDAGKALANKGYYGVYTHNDVRGGSGPAIVYALTKLLAHKNAKDEKNVLGEIPEQYDYIGLVENDVVLPKDWFEPTMALFEEGKTAGLEVGAVSARCYEDRVLIQRPSYAITHNLGAGMIIFTREAAQLVLKHYRTQWTSENRAAFAMLTGTDIGKYWAFRGQEHFLVADWRWDALLASHGLASLALTPSHVEMIGQIPSLEKQGLTIATGGVATLRPRAIADDDMFKLYRTNLIGIRHGKLKLPDTLFFHDQQGGHTIFAHQIGAIGGHYQGNWKLKDSPGFGPFGWIADSAQEDFDPRVFVPIFGPAEIMVSGGAVGGEVMIIDEQSGWTARPVLPSEGKDGTIITVNLPGSIAYRTIRINMLTPGCIFYGVRCQREQPRMSNWTFDWNTLPHGRHEL
jgi:hypothetical protein